MNDMSLLFIAIKVKLCFLLAKCHWLHDGASSAENAKRKQSTASQLFTQITFFF